MARELKIVKLIEPELCLDCRFAKKADVTDELGREERMLSCSRLDCDNWDIVNAQPARDMRIID